MTQEQPYMPTQDDYSEMFVQLTCNDILALGTDSDKYTREQKQQLLDAMDKASLAMMVSLLKEAQ